jgi:hypothetical protein
MDDVFVNENVGTGVLMMCRQGLKDVLKFGLDEIG